MRKLPNLERVDTQILITVPFVLGFIFAAIFASCYSENYSVFPSIIFLTLAFFFWGLAGIPMIVRKEAPGYLLKGYLVVIQGWTLVIVCWSAVILLLVGSIVR